MIPQRTVLILGAGASRPYLFPTGRELTNLILERNENQELLANMGFGTNSFTVGNQTWAGDPENPFRQYHVWFEERLRVHNVAKYELEEFQRRFRLSQSYSVDAFVVDNPDYKILASLMIACILLRCEKTERLDGDWYQFIFNELVSDGKNFSTDNLSVVTFNYDRSFEKFFHQAFINRYNLKPAEALKLVKRIPIIHVYGDLGPLFSDHESADVGYGSDGAMRPASEHIKLVVPRLPSERTSDIGAVLDHASRIIFLGFGFDNLNLQPIKLADPSRALVFASCYGLSAPDMSHAERGLRRNPIFTLNIGDDRWIRWGEKSHKVAEFLHNSLALA